MGRFSWIPGLILLFVLWWIPGIARAKPPGTSAEPSDPVTYLCDRPPGVPQNRWRWVGYPDGSMAPSQDDTGVLPNATGGKFFVYEPDSPGCRASQAAPKAPPKASPAVVKSVDSQKKKDAEALAEEEALAKEKALAKAEATRKAEALAKEAAEARKKEETRKQAEALKKKKLAARIASANDGSRSARLAPITTQLKGVTKKSAHHCDIGPASRAAPGKVASMPTLERDPSSMLAAPFTPAPVAGMKKPEPPPPPGKDYAAHKRANDARQAEEAEVDRLNYELGGRFGAALGEIEAGFSALDIKYFPGMTGVTEHLSRSSDPSHAAQAASLRDAKEARLATELSVLAHLPTYDDPKLADIAKAAFERGCGAGIDEVKVRAFAIDLAFTAAMSLSTTAANAVERAGEAALKAALTKLKSMPIFLPTAVGGAGGFLRVVKNICRSLTAADLGLSEGAIVEGTFAVRGGKATAYIKYLGKPKGVPGGLGDGLLGARASLKAVARAEGATMLRIESSMVIEPTNRLGPALRRAGFEVRPNGTMWWEGSL